MFKGKIALFCMALAFVCAAAISAGAQTQPKKARQPGASDQTPAQLNEPENYRATMVVHIIPTGGSSKISIPPLRFDVAKMGADRRWSFRLPQIGEVIYLEDGARKYLVLPARKQYAEIDPQEIGAPLPWTVTPARVIEYIKQHTNFVPAGSTVISGRRATMYKAIGAAKTGTPVGRVKAETVVFVGEGTGLPLRVELDSMSSSGAGARVIIETENIDTSPQASLFDVPTGMNKVSAEEMKQGLNNFIETMRALNDALSQQQAAR